MAHLTVEKLAKYFDHTNLSAAVTHADLDKLCREATSYGFASVAINSVPTAHCARLLKGSSVAVDAAISFPLGQTAVPVKVKETRVAIEEGADEIDYVINITELKEGNLAYVAEEMRQIVEACRAGSVICKVIFENCYLTEAEKREMCAIAKDIGPDFVKTSTGFGTGGATLADVEMMLEHSGCLVKAAGGIRTLADAQAFIDLGVSRIGSSAGIAIVEEFKTK